MSRFLAFALLVLVSAPVAAQPPGATVRGIVRDASGGPADGVKAMLIHRDTNAVRSVETTGDGQYVVTALPPGPYRLELSRDGFKAHVEEFVLFVSQDLRVDASLQVGAPSEQVVVLASSIALERDSTAVGTIVENAQVVNLPLDGRNFLELALLAPGTAPGGAGIGQFGARRLRIHRQRRPRGRQRLPARRRGQRRSEAEHAGGSAAGRRHS